jgi:antitoxin component HigA of HigAB toxin-antitoxin module
VTDSLPRAAPNSVSIRRTIQESLETESVQGVRVNIPQDWEEAYRAAVLETDYHKLADKIDLAVTVLTECLLEVSSSPEHIGERQRIEDALRTLDMIRRIELQIPA